MSRINDYLRQGKNGLLMFWCPGCKTHHSVWVGEGSGPRWCYNGDPDKPTFTPSLLVRYRKATPEGERMMRDLAPLPLGETRYPGTDEVCHTFITDGQIQFLGDCTHALAGQTVQLPKLPGAE